MVNSTKGPRFGPNAIKNELITYDVVYGSFDPTFTAHFLIYTIEHPILGQVDMEDIISQKQFEYNGYSWVVSEMYMDGKVQLKRFEDLDVDGYTQKFRRWILQTI